MNGRSQQTTPSAPDTATTRADALHDALERLAPTPADPPPTDHRFEGSDMHPLLMMELVQERHARLRADAEQARLVTDPRRPGRRRRRAPRSSSLLARRWPRQPSTPGPRSAPFTTLARPAGFGDLAERLAADGPAAVENELRRLIDHARVHGATPVLMSILTDVAQPDVARQRAFGRILVELDEQRLDGAPSSSVRPDAA